MTVDSEEDLEKLRQIGKIVALALKAMAEAIRPGMSTAELDQVGGQVLQQYGARSAPRLVYDFPGDTCISVNDEAAHGIPGGRLIQPGDLVNVDVSAERDGFYADAALTVPVPPTTPAQRKLLRCTRRALRKGIAAAQVGAGLNEIGRAVEGEAKSCGFQVLRQLSGHGVGRSIHEDPHNIANYFNPSDKRRIQEGLVLTVEPFLSMGGHSVVTAEDGWTLKTKDGSLCAQFEHTLVVHSKRPIVITEIG